MCISSELTSLKVIWYGDQLVWNAHSYLRLFPVPITPICSSIDEVLIAYQLWAQCWREGRILTVLSVCKLRH